MAKEMTEAAGVADSGPAKYSIKGLLALTPEGQLEVFGLNNELEAMRGYLAEMDKLEGKARDEAESEITRMFTPDVSGSRMKWALEDAKRAAKRTGKEEACDCSPCSVMD